jgi:hypothetical protein
VAPEEKQVVWKQMILNFMERFVFLLFVSIELFKENMRPMRQMVVLEFCKNYQNVLSGNGGHYLSRIYSLYQ